MTTYHQGLTGVLRNIRLWPDNHWVYKSLDAVLTAHIRPREKTKDLFHSVIRRRSSNYNRIASLLNLFDRLRPGLSEKTARALLRANHAPLAAYQFRLLAYGSGATVFLLENGQDKKVLKVFRRSLGKSEARVLEVAQEYQEKHETLTRWFNHTDAVVIPSLFLVLHGPLLGITSAAVLQPFVPGKKLDLFLDLSLEEVIQLGKQDEQFRRQLLDFASSLFQQMETTGRCFDLVGQENLMLVETGGSYRLAIADIGIFDLQYIQQNAPALYDRLQSHLRHLKLIQEALQQP